MYILFVLQVVNKKYHQEYDIATPITFDADDVALDIPDDGIQTESGWEILPVQKARVSQWNIMSLIHFRAFQVLKQLIIKYNNVDLEFQTFILDQERRSG